MRSLIGAGPPGGRALLLNRATTGLVFTGWVFTGPVFTGPVLARRRRP